jgi:UDP-N-acetylglucosamine:LPS N-acetylglucosamine transferase
MEGQTRKILAVASGGGHWVQLMRLRPAFEGFRVEYLTTNSAYASEVDGPLHAVTDANLWEKAKLLKMFFQVLRVVLKSKPDIVLTTGAAPGYAALLFGRLLGKRTIWIDSIANSEQLSNSGAKARRIADLWLTQWAHLAKENGPRYWGSVI